MSSVSAEVKNLRRDLLSANETIEELHYELKRYQDNLAEAIAERNRYKTEIFEARGMILNIKQQVDDQVTRAINVEKEKIKVKLDKVDVMAKELNEAKESNKHLDELLNEKDAIINKYKMELRQLAHEQPDNLELAEKIQDIENFREDRIINVKQLQRLTLQNQSLTNKIEDILAENRLLRNLAQVPDNYGFDLEEIKLAERQKIEDYKAQVRYQEKEIEELEEERAKLRYRLRQMSTLFSNKPGERYKDLNAEDIGLLDEYAMNLKEGIKERPLNDRSRDLQREVDKLKGQIEILETQNFSNLESYFEKFRDKLPTKGFVNIESDGMKKTDDEIKQYIIKLMEIMGGQKDQAPQQHQTASILSMPPTPIQGPFGNWGDIREGFSQRFHSKMAVDTSGLYNEGGFDQIGAKYEIAFLQLHNLECLKLLHQKEIQYESISNEAKELKEEIKKCLLVEDELFKTYFIEKKALTEKMEELEKNYNLAKDQIDELTSKVKLYEDNLSEFTSRNPSSMEAKLAHHTKRVALLDVNLIRLSRKYDCLSEEEKQLRDAYNKAETNNAERQEYLCRKLYDLIEWKTKASKQLEILLEFQKNSFPIDEKKNLEAKYMVMNNTYCDMLARLTDYQSKLAKKQSAERELFEKKEENRDLENELIEVELELEVMKKRLEQLDPYFKRYMSIFQIIVDKIKEKNISPLAVFKQFDVSNDGRISKNEFSNAVRSIMKIDLKDEELDVLFLFIDLDGTGNIEYKEFLRRLRRSGVSIRRKEDDLIFSIYQAISEVGMTLEQAFEAFDRNGDNMISKKDMVDTFVSMERNVEKESVDYIFRIADVSGDGLINFQEFYRLFETIVKDAKMENKRQAKTELDWKMQLMLKIDAVIHSQNLRLLDAFNMIDNNGDQKVTFDEFQVMFKQMNIQIAGEELRNLFNVIDLSHNGDISYNELLNYIRECRREKERVERLQKLTTITEKLRVDIDNASQVQKLKGIVEENPNLIKETENNRFEMKITLLEIREKNSNKKIEQLLHQLRNSEDVIADLNKYVKELEISLLKANEEYYNERKSNLILQEKVNGGIPKKDAVILELGYEKVLLENVSLKAANNTFRNLYQASFEQTSTLRITLQKSRTEVETFKRTIKELEGSGDRESMIGKLYYSLMISKWNEGEVNKKYDGILTEFRRVASTLSSIEEKVDEKDEEILATHTMYREKIIESEKTITELKMKIIPTITVTRIENLAHTVKEFSAMKTDLEIANKKLRDANYELSLNVDALESHKSSVDELEKQIKKNNSGDDMNQQLIEMSKRMREYKLAELKARREASSAAEKEEYYQRMGRQHLDNIKNLENELAEWDIKFAKREEFWHKRYQEQVRIVFRTGNKSNVLSVPEKELTLTSEKEKDEEPLGLGKGLEIYKKAPSQKKNVQLEKEIIEKNTEINVLKKKLEESQAKHDDQIKRNQELEELILTKENDISTVNKISGHVKTEENERLAMAAQKTMQTLQAIISDKNLENERKDRYIDKLKQDFYFQKENDALEIKELYDKLRQQNQEFSRQKPNYNASQVMGAASFLTGNISNYQGGIMPDVNNLLNEKDERIDSLQNQLEVELQTKKQLEGNHRKLLEEIEDLKKDLMIEKDKNTPEKFMQEIETLKKLIKHKDKEVKGFKESITKLKEEFFKACDEKLENEKEYQNLENKLTRQGTNNSQIETKLKQATKKIEEVNSKIRSADAQIEEMKIKEIEWKEKYNKLKSEKDHLQDMLDQTTRDKNGRKRETSPDKITIEEKNISNFLKPKFENEKKERGKFKKEELKKSYEGDELQESDAHELKHRIAELEKEILYLKKEKAPNLIDQNGYLQKENSIGFRDLKDLIETMREWLKHNPQLEIYKALKENDKKRSGILASEIFYSELKINGINLKPRDQALLDKSLKDIKGFINYIDFYFMLKNMKSCEITAKSRDEAALERKSTLKEKPLTSSEKAVVEILKNNLNEMKKEKDLLEKQLINWKENAMNYQNQLKTTQNKFPKENVGEGGSNKNFLTLQDYKNKVFVLEEKLHNLEKLLTVDKEIQMNKINEEKRKLEIELKHSKLENVKLKSQVEKFSAKKLTENDLKEEIESEKEMIIINLKGKIDESRENEENLKKKLMEAESKIMDLQFVKENFDIQIERYQRRVTELEDVKAFYEDGSNKLIAKPMKQPASGAIKREGFKTLKK